jgi:hypothetical protein
VKNLPAVIVDLAPLTVILVDSCQRPQNRIPHPGLTRAPRSNRVHRVPTNGGCVYREAMPLSPRVASHSKTRRTSW